MRNFRKLLVFLVLAGVAGCSRGPKNEPWYVEKIELADATLRDNASLVMTTEDLRNELFRAFGDSRRFVPLAEGKRLQDDLKPMNCRVEVAFTRESSNEQAGARTVKAEVGVVMELKRPGEIERYHATGFGRQAFAPEQAGTRLAAFRKALAQALDQAVESEAMQLGALQKTDEALIADLGATDARVRDYAVRVLAERKNPAAVPALIERLNDTDREVSMHAVGALGAIGDPRAVPALIELSQNRDPAFMLALVEVIATIGGRDAEGYLFTLASGHPDLSVRRAAEDAERRVRERAKAPKPLPAVPAKEH